MGARGPAPTPTTMLRLRGSWRAGSRSGEPEPTIEAPSCPEWLSKEAKAEWRRVVPELLLRRTLSKADRAMLAGYCQAWGEFADAAKAVEAKKKHEGHIIDHPRVAMARAFERLIKAADRFGLSPAAKARVRGEAGEEKPEGGKSRFFGGAA